MKILIVNDDCCTKQLKTPPIPEDGGELQVKSFTLAYLSQVSRPFSKDDLNLYRPFS